MPNWSSQIPEDIRGGSLPLVRTPAGKPVKAIVTSHALIGCHTHFFGGHTVPCDSPDCKACNEGIPSRWHGYVACYHFTSSLHFIFEMTVQAAIPLQEYFSQHKTLRGAQIEAYRWGKRANGRVVMKVEPGAVPPNLLPAAPDIPRIMALIWQLPPQNVTVEERRSLPFRFQTTSKGNGESADPRDYVDGTT
jgi:hypothetical protein